MSKLTLHVSDELVEAAKNEAALRGTSVSQLVSDFFKALKPSKATSKTKTIAKELPPKTAQLLGCIRESDHDDKASYVDYLERKHS